MMLTISRFFFVPFIVQAVEIQQWGLASVLFALAAITDFLDGFLARLWNQQSKIGSYLDPLADKFLMIGCYYSLFAVQVLPAWFFIGICCKELVLVGAAALYGCSGASSMVPLWSGKSAMMVQVLFVASIFLMRAYSTSSAIPFWVILGVLLWSIMPLVHYALNISWRFV